MWNRLRWKLQSFMIGRNGLDELGKANLYCIICIDVVALIIGRWLPIPGAVLTWISYALCVLFVYRAFSKKIIDRRKENDKYTRTRSLWTLRISQRKEYKIFACKGCGRNIRVPRGKGKIEVRCPVCGDITIHRT